VLCTPGVQAGWANVPGMTCATPDSTHIVHLPRASRREFDGIGSAVGTTRFSLELGDCGAHAAEIDYALLPSYQQSRHRAWQRSNGALIPDSSSSARGVVVQVLDAHARPVVLEAPELHPVVAESVSTNSVKIPLQAQYIQTEPTITPGSLHAAMTVVYSYH